MLDTAPTPIVPDGTSTPAEGRPRTGAVPTSTGAVATSTGAIRTMGANPQTAPIMLHPGDAISTARRVVYIVLLGALTALGPFTIDMYLPAFPVLQRDFDTTEAAIQLTLTGTMIGFALGQLIVGPLSDKFGRRVPLIAVTVLHVCASVFAALSPDLVTLGAARVLMGMGAAAGGVVAMAIVRDLFGGRRLVQMLSRLALITGVAPVVAPLIGSVLLEVMPWQGLFVVLALYGAVMVACVVIGIRETLPPARRQSGSVLQRYRSVFGDRVFIGALVIGGMTFSGLFSYLSASSFLFQETYGFDAQLYGLLFAVNSVGLIIGTQTAARLAARFGPQWVLAFSTVALVVFGAIIVLGDQLGWGVWGVVVPLFLFMTTCGFTMPCVQVLALDRHGRAAGTAASILGAANFGVAGVVSPLVGWVSGESGITATSMAAVMVGCGVIAVVALWAIVRPRSVAKLAP